MPLSPNKTAAQTILSELQRKVEMAKAGVADPFEQHRTRPLAEHVGEWEAALKASGASAKHVRQTVVSVRRIIRGCQFVYLGDLSASRVQGFLAEMRGARAGSEVDPDKKTYTKTELGSLTGMKMGALSAALQRHKLEGTGNGKARRYSAETAKTLLALRSKGRSIKTMNLYLDGIKAFCRWLVQDRRMADNPLSHLSGGNVKLDRRHDRRPLSEQELRDLLQAAWSKSEEVQGLAGDERAMLYLLGSATGFRASELASLTPAAFDLAAAPSTVTLSAENAKNGRTAVQPLSPDVADIFANYLAAKPKDLAIWPAATWAKKAAAMIRSRRCI